LVAEAKQCETMVEVEVRKVKAGMEKEVEKVKVELEEQVEKTNSEIDNETKAKIAQYCKEIEISGIKFEAMKKNYHTRLVCSWIFFLHCIFSSSDMLPKTNRTVELVV
jgi:hypothetical protein